MAGVFPQPSHPKKNDGFRSDQHSNLIPLQFPTPERLHNFPAQATPLMGRQQELAATRQMLARPDVHLVTLVGPAGIGKTRLAVEAAAILMDEFDNGTSFVDLSAISNPALVISTIARSLGVMEFSDQTILKSLLLALQHKHLLLVLDNLEQVVEAAADLSQLLSFCPKIKMLITSREALHLRWEHIFRVPPLGVPDVVSTATPQALLEHPAVALFVERSRAVCSDFQLTDHNSSSVAQICCRLDGLPLAIELAAARSNVLAPATMVELLQGRLDLLTGGARDLPERHQTLRGAISWSYDLLPQSEQTLFRRLGVLVGSWTLEGARAVFAPGSTSVDLVDGLTSLVNKSLLQREELPDGELRMRMLETVREYALEKLVDCGKKEIESTRRRHAEYCLGLAEKAEQHSRGPEQAEWAARVEKERDNLRTALRWCLDTGEGETGLRLCAALWLFWEMKGELTEGRRWLEEALSRFDNASSSRRAAVLIGAGLLAWRQCDYKRGAELLQASLAKGHELGDKLIVMRSLGGLGQTVWAQGDHEAALPLLEESLALARDMGTKPDICIVLNILGCVAAGLKDYTRSRSLYEESVVLAKELDDKRLLARPLANLAGIAQLQNDLRQASQLGNEALVLACELGDRPVVPLILGVIGTVASAMGQSERAVRLFAAAESLSEAIGAEHAPVSRGIYAPHLENARRQLTGRAVEAALAAGRAMNLDEAVAYALEVAELDAPPQPKDAVPYQLTQREREVAVLIAQGHSNQEIAAELVISKRTADSHVANILGKLGFTSRAQIAAWAVEQGLSKSNDYP